MDVWKIGVAISLSNGMSPVLAIIAADLLGIKGKVGEVERAFNGWNTAIMGAGGVLAGGALMAGLVKMVEHGKELVHVQAQMAIAGMDQLQVAEATAKAWEISAKYGLKVSEVAGDIKEARMVYGSTEHAIDFIEPLEKMRVVLNSVSEGSGGRAKDAVYEAARTGELKGLITPEEFTRYFDGMTKAISASGGKIDPKAYLQATQYGRIASKGWDEEFFTKYLPSMIQEMGPTQSGTALMSLFGSVVQGKVTKRSLGMMDDIGLIGDPSKIIYNKLGDPTGFQPGALAGTDLMTKDPFRWSQEILRPLVEKKLGHDVAPGDQDSIKLLSGMFGSRTAAQAIATLLLEGQRIRKDAGLIGEAKGTDAAEGLLTTDPTAAMNNFKNSWDNLMTALGAPLVQTAINAMNGIADVMKSITGFAVAHPEAIKLIGEAIAGVSLALIALGGAAIVGAAVAIVGPVAAAVTALGVIIATIAAFNWQAIVAVFDGIYNAIVQFIEKMKALVASIAGAILGAASGIGNFQPFKPRINRDPNHPSLFPADPASYVPPAPPSANQNSVIHTSIQLDGRTLAKAVSQHMANNGAWSNSSSSFDGRAMPAPTDVSYI